MESIYNFLANGRGPLGRLSPLLQCVVFFVGGDFLLYWSHRLFHRRGLWPVHAIHHSPRDVDWTTAYRFHPLNFAFGPWLMTTVMIFLGVAPVNIIFVAPIEVAMAYFVHANLNVTLGPLKYLIATPVFHRWHHARRAPGDACNYGANFAFWDVAFGTFYFSAGRVPADYGVEGDPVPENVLAQLVYPLKSWWISFFYLQYRRGLDSLKEISKNGTRV